MMKLSWRTAWQGQDIVVFKNDIECDRVHAADIERVVFIHHGSGDCLSDLVLACVELAGEVLVFPAETGFAGRVNFERQAFWAEKACVYWVNEARAPLPMKLRRHRWFLGLTQLEFTRMPKAELTPFTERWTLQGPQTWEQRKRRRIERSRPFAALTEARLSA